jgi:MFS family permease
VDQVGEQASVGAWVEAVEHFRSDRDGRRVPYVRIGYGLPVVGKSLMAVAVAWPMVLAGRLVDRLGKGLRASPRDALIADAAGPAIRGRAFGFHRAMDTAGAMAGVLLAAAVLW